MARLATRVLTQCPLASGGSRKSVPARRHAYQRESSQHIPLPKNLQGLRRGLPSSSRNNAGCSWAQVLLVTVTTPQVHHHDVFATFATLGLGLKRAHEAKAKQELQGLHSRLGNLQCDVRLCNAGEVSSTWFDVYVMYVMYVRASVLLYSWRRFRMRSLHQVSELLLLGLLREEVLLNCA